MQLQNPTNINQTIASTFLRVLKQLFFLNTQVHTLTTSRTYSKTQKMTLYTDKALKLSLQVIMFITLIAIPARCHVYGPKFVGLSSFLRQFYLNDSTYSTEQCKKIFPSSISSS